jgi:hypothetical protein
VTTTARDALSRSAQGAGLEWYPQGRLLHLTLAHAGVFGRCALTPYRMVTLCNHSYFSGKPAARIGTITLVARWAGEGTR